ncbi:GNAT family N-acetyltransferase [Propionivibrio soli]|uniref:GNAT family N-acetyltransferase n=1 Tax=Propionivibrio soli TaxID=2976531 RepID=UPI0021E7E5BD|nr:GNAT family N-acyltransferase [Propionivibrio soli]
MKQTSLAPQRERNTRRSRLTVSLAQCEWDILQAQKLRYRIFAGELGANLPTRTPGVDKDIFDPYCEHLVVRDEGSDAVVGTCRILSPMRAVRVGSFYSENGFDLTRLQHLRSRMIEVGRLCVHPAYRTGRTIDLLFRGIGLYMDQNHYEYLLACPGVSMTDGGHAAASAYARLGEYLSPLEYRVFPRCPLPLASLDRHTPVHLPPLVKGCLRIGAYVCGEPAWDPDFNNGDFPILLPVAALHGRYARRLGHPSVRSEVAATPL